MAAAPQHTPRKTLVAQTSTPDKNTHAILYTNHKGYRCIATTNTKRQSYRFEQHIPQNTLTFHLKQPQPNPKGHSHKKEDSELKGGGGGDKHEEEHEEEHEEHEHDDDEPTIRITFRLVPKISFGDISTCRFTKDSNTVQFISNNGQWKATIHDAAIQLADLGELHTHAAQEKKRSATFKHAALHQKVYNQHTKTVVLRTSQATATVPIPHQYHSTVPVLITITTTQQTHIIGHIAYFTEP